MFEETKLKPEEDATPGVSKSQVSNTNSKWIKLAVIGGCVVLAGLFYYLFGEHLTIAGLAEKEAEIRAFQVEHPVLIYAVALLVYVTITGLSLPGALVLTIVYGWFFGVIPGILVVSFASTAGATVAFLISRYLFRDAFQTRFGESLRAFNKALDKEGAFYLFSLRLIPAVPFFVINVVMGLTKIKTTTFWWVSQLGMLAGTSAYVYAGSTFPNLKTLAEEGVGSVVSLPLIIAFAVLGLLPLFAKKVVDFFRDKHSAQPTDHEATAG